MQAKKKAALEAAGWKFGDAEEFLGMNGEEQRELVRHEAEQKLQEETREAIKQELQTVKKEKR